MSVCGGCSYPFEKVMAGEAENENCACDYDCTHEDAVYRMQWAYDQLYERYQTLEDEKRALEQKYEALKLQMEDDGK